VAGQARAPSRVSLSVAAAAAAGPDPGPGRGVLLLSCRGFPRTPAAAPAFLRLQGFTGGILDSVTVTVSGASHGRPGLGLGIT
jgi:hypothetical protein